MPSPLQLVVSLAAVLAAGAPVSAQQARPERPYRGLFGGGVGDAQQLLTFNLSAGGGYDDNVLADTGVGGDPTQAKGGNFGSISTGLNYSFSGTDWSFGASGSANTRYSPSVTKDFTTGASVGMGLSGGLWRGARFGLSTSAGYQPYYTLSLFPSLAEPALGDAPPTQFEYGAIADDYFSYSGSANLSQSVSSRGSLAFQATAQRSDFRSGDHPDTTSYGAGGGYSYSLARGLALRLGYGFSEHDSPGRSEPNRVHSVDAGVNFNRAISFSRRTTLAFSTGTAATTDGSSDPQYHLTGGVSLRHDIGRTWGAAAGYSRSVRFIDALAQTYVSDGASATFGGLITRRLQFSSQASVGFAQKGSRGGANFDTYLGSLGLTYGVTRSLAMGVTYSYYRYEFAAGAVPPPGFGRELDRQSVTANISFWTPLMYRARRPDAPR